MSRTQTVSISEELFQDMKNRGISPSAAFQFGVELLRSGMTTTEIIKLQQKQQTTEDIRKQIREEVLQEVQKTQFDKVFWRRRFNTFFDQVLPIFKSCSCGAFKGAEHLFQTNDELELLRQKREEVGLRDVPEMPKI